MKSLLIISLAACFANAATIKQLLNEQNLAVLEVSKGESVNVGDHFISSNGTSQCLIEVLSVKDKNVTASTKQCSDKSSLTTGKKVEKSLIDPTLLSQSNSVTESNAATNSSPTETNGPSTETKNEAHNSLAPHDLNFWPKQGQLAAGLGLNSNRSTLKNDSTSASVDTRYDVLQLIVGIGITNNVSASVNLRNVTGGDLKTGSQSPVFSASIHSDPWEKDEVVSLGISLCPKGSDGDALNSNYAGISLSVGKIYSDSSVSIKAESIAVAETDSYEKKTMSALSINYQSNFTPTAFVQLSFGLQQNSNENSKTSNLTIEYGLAPLLGIGVGINNSAKTFSGLVSLTSFASKVTAKTSTNTDLTYTGGSVNFSAAFAF